MVFLEYINFEHNTVAAELVRQTYDTPPLAFVHSYGCQQNVNDGERIKGVLMDIGYGLCDKPEDADLILFNTCAVREHAEQRVFGNVGALKGLKEKKRGLMIGLCGCMANQKHVVEKLRKSYPYVDLVFGVDGIDTLPQLIAQKLQKHKRVLMEPAQRPVIVENIPIRRESEFRAWLPIMYGCDNFCTYCIIPYARGRVRSMPLQAAVEQAKGLAAEGYREIVINGIEISSWGWEWKDGSCLRQLLAALCAAVPAVRIRLGSLEPRTIDEDFCKALCVYPNLCPQFHLSLQSGCTATLRRMRRVYTAEQYAQVVDQLRAAYGARPVSFTTDCICGFPGETQADFEESCEFLKKIGFLKVHVFPYSRRSGTPAYDFPDQIHEREKQERSRVMNGIAEEVRREVLAAYVGTEDDVLLETPLSGTLFTGYTRLYIPVVVSAPGHESGQIVHVRLGEYDGERVRAALC